MGRWISGEHQAYLSHVESSSEIYLQLSLNSQLLEEVTAQLQSAGPVGDPEVYSLVGHACMAQFSPDKAWYRSVSLPPILSLH